MNHNEVMEFLLLIPKTFNYLAFSCHTFLDLCFDRGHKKEVSV